MADLVVDVDGLESLIGTAQRIKAGLDGTKALVEHTSAAMGSGKVSGALEDFPSHWQDGRKHIDTNADTMISMLSRAVSAYRKTEQVASHGWRLGPTGARADVGPSGMARDMGDGLVAYVLAADRAPTRANLVDVFSSPADPREVTDVVGQRASTAALLGRAR